jgi:hypothetical protein
LFYQQRKYFMFILYDLVSKAQLNQRSYWPLHSFWIPSPQNLTFYNPEQKFQVPSCTLRLYKLLQICYYGPWKTVHIEPDLYIRTRYVQVPNYVHSVMFHTLVLKYQLTLANFFTQVHISCQGTEFLNREQNPTHVANQTVTAFKKTNLATNLPMFCFKSFYSLH